MKNDNLLEIFSVLSKAVIIIPIVVVVIALIFKFNKQPQQPLDYSFRPTLTIVPPTIQTPFPIKLDLKGPLVCGSKVDSASTSAFIKDKKIKIIFNNKNERENILVSGDCFYNWDEGEFTGRRVCGLSPLLSIAETMASFGGLRADLLFNQLNNLGINNKIATDQAKINALVKSCKQEVIDESVFEVPTSILFRNN